MKRLFLFFAIALLISTNVSAGVYRKPMPNIPSAFSTLVPSDFYSVTIVNQIFSRLFDIDEYNQIVPKLASDWSVDSSGISYRICVKDNVLFHDGKPLTSADLVFTLNKLISKESFMSSEMQIVKGAADYANGKAKTVAGITIVSANCLNITLERPFPIFLSLLAAVGSEILPNQFRGKSSEEFFKAPVGTGPFKILKFEPEKYVELTPNEKYFLGAPKLSSLVYEKADRQSAISGFNKGYYQDLEWFYPQITELTTDYSVIKIPVSKTNVFALNARRQPISNVHFRKAISYAISKNRLIDACFPGNTMAKGYVPPGMAGYSASIPDYEYNPAKAKEELKLAKLPKDLLEKQLIIFRADNYPCKDTFKKIIETNLKDVGINAVVQNIPYSDIINNHYKNRDYDLINISFTADFPEALFMLNDFRSSSPLNYSGYSSKEIDGLLKTANMASDRFERYQAYEKIQKLLFENAVTVNLYYHIASIVMRSNVKGFVPSPLGTYYSSMWPVYIEGDVK